MPTGKPVFVGRLTKEPDILLIYEMWLKGASWKEIAQKARCSIKTAYTNLREYLKEQEEMQKWKNIEAIELVKKRKAIIESITQKKINEASLANLGSLYKDLLNCEKVIEAEKKKSKSKTDDLAELLKRKDAS